MVFKSVPRSNRCVAQLCRNRWERPFSGYPPAGRLPAPHTILFSQRLVVRLDGGPGWETDKSWAFSISNRHAKPPEVSETKSHRDPCCLCPGERESPCAGYLYRSEERRVGK